MTWKKKGAALKSHLFFMNNLEEEFWIVFS